MTGPMLFDLDPKPELTPTPADTTPAAARPSKPSAPAQTQSLYRKYRPQSFGEDDLVGQEHVVRTLRNAVALDRVAHAYLFCGPRGTGKTTTARLLAKAVNCLDPDPANRPCNRCASCLAITSGATTDVIEIDAASNRGIDDIRDLRERVKYAPTQLRTKFYIVDEAHQITGAAGNAFLKTLEEPPAHTKFVLATTDPEDLLPTIVSRCQRFDFRRIALSAMVGRLRTVANAEGIEADDAALEAIARASTGSLRDALGLLDQLAVYQETNDGQHPVDGKDATTRVITVDAVRALLGVSRNDRIEALVEALANRDAGAALGGVNDAVEAGEDPRQLNRQLVTYLRMLMHERAGGSLDADDRARALAGKFDLIDLARLAKRFAETDTPIRHASIPQLPLEIALVEGIVRSSSTERDHPTAAVANRPASPTTTTHQEATPPTAAETAEPTAVARPQPSPRTPPAARTGPSLKDRIRDPSLRVVRHDDPKEAVTLSAPSPPSPVPQADPEPTSPGVSAGPDGADPLEQLVELWPRIRQDVKAVNRRIEALLAEVDPIAIKGNHVILRASYPFHRNRLETDEVRSVVAEAIGRRLGLAVEVKTTVKGDAPDSSSLPALRIVPDAPPARGPVRTAAPAEANTGGEGQAITSELATEPNAAGSADSDDTRRLNAAKTIFDAEEIDDPELDEIPSPTT